MPAKIIGDKQTASPVSAVGRTLKRRPRAKHGAPANSPGAAFATERVERSIHELFRLTLDIKQRLGLG
ncbi:MAG TPA: hypothetical protein VHK66_01445 [Microvirga sp.]|jgi:hypothetical protein|nr:hypothetical protein [Microvirga sp.]